MQSNSFLASIQAFWTKNKGQVTVILAVFLLAGMFMELSGNHDGKADVFSSAQPAAFDGLVQPVLKSPNWVALTSAEYKAPYDQIPAEKLQPLPMYNADNLKIPASSLTWNDHDKQIRDEKITFSTPYMGDYKLDGIENAGSHLAVDIKVPQGTPVYAIGNGVVVTASMGSTGFGHHIVIKHVNFPSFDNPNVLTTYYSSYNHMSDVMVSEGQVVTKGQLIGKSGETGTATTPHVHFQIDQAAAPFHPYWPYTYLEATQAGYDFNSAIDAGFGKEKALANTINPLIYVQKYMNAKSTVAVSKPVATPVSTPAPTPVTPTAPSTPAELPPIVSVPPVVVPVVTPAVSPVSTPVVAPVVTPDVTPVAVNTPVVAPVDAASAPTPEVPLNALNIKMSKSFVVNVPQTITIQALDVQGNVLKNYHPANPVYVKVENGSAKISNNYVDAQDFVNGEAQLTLTPFAEFGIRVSATDGNISALSDFIQNSNFADIAQRDNGFVAVNFLKNHGVVAGYPDGQFHPEGKISRVEALKMIYEGFNKPVENSVALQFKDTDSNAWYASYIAAAVNDGIVQGYAGNLFKPANSVTRAEFLKMLLEASGSKVEAANVGQKPFVDVDIQAWYGQYVAFAKNEKILDTSMNKFFPDQQLTRGDAADMLYRSILLKVSNLPFYTDGLVVSNDSLDKFFMN